DARVVDQDGGGAELLGDPRDGGFDLRLVGDVAADGDGLPTRGGDLLDGVLAGGLVEVDHGDGAALGGQSYGGGGADAARGTGDDRDPLLSGGHCCFSSPLGCGSSGPAQQVSDRLVPSADVTLEALARGVNGTPGLCDPLPPAAAPHPLRPGGRPPGPRPGRRPGPAPDRPTAARPGGGARLASEAGPSVAGKEALSCAVAPVP